MFHSKIMVLVSFKTEITILFGLNYECIRKKKKTAHILLSCFFLFHESIKLHEWSKSRLWHTLADGPYIKYTHLTIPVKTYLYFFFFQVRLMSYMLCRELLVSQNHLLSVRLHWQCRWIATPTTYQDQCNPSCFKFLTQGHRGSCLYWVIAEGKKNSRENWNDTHRSWVLREDG